MAGEGQGLDYLVVLGALYYERQDYGVFLGVGTHARDIVRNAVQGQAIYLVALPCHPALPSRVSRLGLSSLHFKFCKKGKTR